MSATLERVAILGTGLLGASTGLALRAAGFSGVITGWDRDATAARTAQVRGAIDTVATSASDAASSSQIIVLAAPVFAILDLMQQLAPSLTPAQLVTDVGSSKALITMTGNRLYNQPGCAAFLPGHPMAGKEVSGAEHADAALFQGAVWIFTETPPSARDSTATLATEWRGWVQRMGATILDLAPERHDELVAWVSHLPQFVATAFTAMLEETLGDAPELKAVGGRALREMTRLGASPYSMWRDVALTNTDSIAHGLHALEQRLAHLRENLKTPELREAFERANRFRQR